MCSLVCFAHSRPGNGGQREGAGLCDLRALKGVKFSVVRDHKAAAYSKHQTAHASPRLRTVLPPPQRATLISFHNLVSKTEMDGLFASCCVRVHTGHGRRRQRAH